MFAHDFDNNTIVEGAKKHRDTGATFVVSTEVESKGNTCLKLWYICHIIRHQHMTSQTYSRIFQSGRQKGVNVEVEKGTQHTRNKLM